jgi:hypothetical protein
LPDSQINAAIALSNGGNRLFVARKVLNKFLSLEFSRRILNGAREAVPPASTDHLATKYCKKTRPDWPAFDWPFTRQ